MMTSHDTRDPHFASRSWEMKATANSHGAFPKYIDLPGDCETLTSPREGAVTVSCG